MAVTTTDNTLVLQKWRRDYWREYQRTNLFAPYMGNGPNAIIHRLYELKDEGEQITVPLVGKLGENGVTGDNVLVGNEQAMDQYGQKITIDWWRDGVVLNKKQMRRSAIDQLEIVRPLLMDESKGKLRNDIIRALHNVGGISISGNVNGTQYQYATTTQKNTWADANSDRILYGATTANYVAGNHAASLANVDNTTDKLTAASLLLMKRLARKTTNNTIRPVTVDDAREYFTTFVGSNNFRDLSLDPTIVANYQNSFAREGKAMENNPLWQDGDIMYRGIIVREIPEIDQLCTIAGAGTSGVNVTPVFMCGAQAVGYAVGQLPAPTERKEDDYGFVKGRGIETCYGIAKIQKQAANSTTLKDWGVATGFFASAAD
jgi:N4-gp56 family major capsid protein